MAGPFRSNSSANTTMTVNLSVWRNGPGSPSTAAYATVNWSVTLGSATSLGSSSNRTLYIYRSDGALLGSAVIKNGVSWSSSTTYSGSFNISFDAGTYNAFTWNLYIQTSSKGTQSCIWTNRTYCTNFAISWPLYWSYATAPSSLSLSPGVFENTVRLSWSGAASGVNNGISTYHCYYQYSDNSGGSWSGETGVDSGGAGYIDVNTTSWPRGRLIRFHVYSISTYNNPLSGYSGTALKNRVPNTPTGTPTTNKSIYSPGETVTVTFTPPSPRDPDVGTTGDITGYEVKMKDAAGTDYNSGQIMGTNASGSATSVSVSTTGWTAGLQWKFLVRGYDAYGVRGSWSAATALVLIGTPLKVLVSGSLKSVAEQQVLVNGVLKQVSEIKVLVDGVLKNLTV